MQPMLSPTQWGNNVKSRAVDGRIITGPMYFGLYTDEQFVSGVEGPIVGLRKWPRWQ